MTNDQLRIPVRSAADWTRRQVLAAGAVAGAGLLLPVSLLPSSTALGGSSSFSGTAPLRLAMHVHGSWSEGQGSWEAQFAQCAANDIDILYMTDHDHRAQALDYLPSLGGVRWIRATAGTLRQQASTAVGDAVRLLAESASATASASVTMTVEPKPTAWNKIYTSIAGQTIEHTFTSARLTGGARYEVTIPLSYHPAAPGRPAGTYALTYRYSTQTPHRSLENGGVTGVVWRAVPAPGTVDRLLLETDVAALWPTMLPIDNCLYGVTLCVRSPRRGAVADVRVGKVAFVRTHSSPAGVRADQQRLVSTYGPRWPDLLVHPMTEVSRTLPDMNAFVVPQYFPDYAALSPDHDTRYAQISAAVHAQGGLMSYNHPFGYATGPLLPRDQIIAKRRALYAAMTAVHAFSADLLEVGYTLRGQVDMAAHLDLWDTFSRHGVFLTGNGTSDDHVGKSWSTLTNGFLTGLWAPSRQDADVLQALQAGRAYAAHAGGWPGGQVDLLVDDKVPMGGTSIAQKATRSLSVFIDRLPANGSAEVLTGPVDTGSAVDPGTTVLRRLTAATLPGGTATFPVDTAVSRFLRVQVRDGTGRLVGTSNPVWLLREEPPDGIPAARRA